MTIRHFLHLFIFLQISASFLRAAEPATVALWLFDEQTGLYPSSLLSDANAKGLPLVLGRGGAIVPGKFGHALAPVEPRPLEITNNWLEEQQGIFGLIPTPKQPGRAVEPMTWDTANFCALFTCGETHLRRMDFVNPTETKLNLGNFDWTVEFWFQASGDTGKEGVVIEIGSGPRGENDLVTRLSVLPDNAAFRFASANSGLDAELATDGKQLADGNWHHVAFTFDAAVHKLDHWLDGKLQSSLSNVRPTQLSYGEEAYFSVGRDSHWQRPLNGKLDELRFSKGVRYAKDFQPPGSFSRTYTEDRPPLKLVKGPPLLFPPGKSPPSLFELGSRKHLFIDDILVEQSEGTRWTVNPPDIAELILEEYHGHLSVVEDEEGVIRIYGSGPHDALVVYTSKDGVHFETPDLGNGEFHEWKNVVLRDPVGMGQVFIDHNAPPAERWKYVSGMRSQGIFVFTSADGFDFRRNETAALPFAAGSQSNVFYDDQRQLYVGYHRSDYGAPSMTSTETERRFVLTEVEDLLQSWEFEPVTTERTREVAKSLRIKSHLLDPWYLDNGPLAPAGIGIEFPVVFDPDDAMDPPHTDIYVPKAEKYAFAPDTYLAFPHLYFHYWDVGEEAREELGKKHRQKGSGVIEVQTMVSRNGLEWKRYPRPSYVGIGTHGELGDQFMVGMVQGMVRRGDQIWQYFTCSPEYHSAWNQGHWGGRKGVFRLVQRLDGFVSMDLDYSGGRVVTKPLRFDGSRLELNVDTGATGFIQVGILNEQGEPLPGFTADDCVYINGNFITTPVEWLGQGQDVSQLAGKVVRLEFRGRGAKLFAMQFTE